MICSNKLGTTRSALCLALLLLATSACERHGRSALPKHNDPQAARNDVREVDGLIEATKENPSLQPGSNQAGPPIHVDPYPHSKGMTHDNMTGMTQEEHPAKSAQEH